MTMAVAFVACFILYSLGNYVLARSAMEAKDKSSYSRGNTPRSPRGAKSEDLYGSRSVNSNKDDIFSPSFPMTSSLKPQGGVNMDNRKQQFNHVKFKTMSGADLIEYQHSDRSSMREVDSSNSGASPDSGASNLQESNSLGSGATPASGSTNSSLPSAVDNGLVASISTSSLATTEYNVYGSQGLPSISSEDMARIRRLAGVADSFYTQSGAGGSEPSDSRK